MDEKKYHYIQVRLNERDYEKFMSAYAGSLHRSKASYAKKLILGKPVRIITRNRSMDEFIETAVRIRKELRLLLSREVFSEKEKLELGRKMSFIEENLINVVDLCRQK